MGQEEIKSWINNISDTSNIPQEVFTAKSFQILESDNHQIWETYPHESIIEFSLEAGPRSGPCRTFLVNHQLMSFGYVDHGKPIGPQWHRKQGGSYLIGHVYPGTNLFHGNSILYLYPNLEDAIVGEFSKGKMTKGYFAKVMGVKLDPKYPKVLLPAVTILSEEAMKYDPSTGLRISRQPLCTDPYDTKTVRVDISKIPFAGEGLYALRNIQEGELICLFNGIKYEKVGHSKAIRAGSEDWSDYRLTLDRSIDIDIPDDCIDMRSYCATLGHKACHSFERKNARFDEIYHPRFGLIMSVVAIKPIPIDEEILVNYNYEVILAPLWYKQQWFHYVSKTLNWSQEKIQEWCDRQVAKWGYPLKIEN